MNQIRMYTRDKHNQKTGILMGVRQDNGTVIITGAKTNTKADSFNREIGINIALNRLDRFRTDGRPIKLPMSLASDSCYFADRCRRYFKTDDIIYPEFKPFVAVASSGSC